jgi:hypothetical protein
MTVNTQRLIPVVSMPTPDGWFLTLRNTTGSTLTTVQVTVWAVCVDQP